MGCRTCKNKDGIDTNESEILKVFKRKSGKTEREIITGTETKFKIFNFIIRFIIFLVSLITVPIIILFIIYLLFKTILLNNGEVNLKPTLVVLANKIGLGNKKIEEKYPEDYDDLESDKLDDYHIAERVDKIKL